MTETLLGLFSRWSQLEPERCRIVEGIKSEMAVDIQRGRSMETIWMVHFGPISGFGLSHLQAALQEAVVERQWRMSLENSSSGWHVVVALGRTGDPPMDMAQIVRSDHEEPAIALLTAYLQALETAQGEG